MFKMEAMTHFPAPRDFDVSSDTELSGVRVGAGTIRNKADVHLGGTIIGSVDVQSGRLHVSGLIRGSLTLRGTAVADVYGTIEGPIHLEGAARMTVRATARIAGPIRARAWQTEQKRGSYEYIGSDDPSSIAEGRALF